MVPKKSQFSPKFCLCGTFLRKVPNSKSCIRRPGHEAVVLAQFKSAWGRERELFLGYVNNPTFLPDPGVSGVRSMGLGLSNYIRELWLKLY